MTLLAFLLGIVCGALSAWALDHREDTKSALQAARAELDAEIARYRANKQKE